MTVHHGTLHVARRRDEDDPKLYWLIEFVTAIEVLELERIEWNSGNPIAAVNRHLDLLADQGWRLVHVSEDRALYGRQEGSGVQRFTMPDRIRYLMVSERP